MLREALSEIEATGLIAAASETRDRCFSSYTTSSEWLGEVGNAITELLHAYGPSIPGAARGKLKSCLSEVAKVWPKYRAF